MGTQVHYKDYIPGYCSMRNLSEDASSSNWPFFYGDRTLTNGQYCNGFMSRSVMDAYPGYDKDAVKQKMLEHEAIFKNQVSELHRLYRIQRDMMQEVKRKEPNRMSMEPSSSSNILGSQLPSEDAQKWHMTSFPLAHSGYARASTSTEIVNSPLSCAKGNNVQSGRLQLQNGFSSKSCEVLEARPSKVRKKLFDLHLPADQYIDTDDGEQLQDSKESFCRSYPANGNFTIPQDNSVKLFIGGCEMSDSQKDASMSNSCLRSAFGLADLNEPAQFEEATITPSSVNFLGHCANPKEAKIPNVTIKPNTGVLASSREMMWNSHNGSSNVLISNLSVESKGKEREWLSYTYEAGNMKNNLLPVSQGFEQNKLPMQAHPATHQNLGIYPTHGSRDDLWRERTGYGLQTFDRARENSNFSRVEPIGSSLFTGPSPFVSSSEFANSWSNSVSALEKPTSSSTQKLTLFHANSSTALSRNTQPSPSPLTGGDKWNANGISRVNPGLGSDLPVKNGFYHGSSSGSREPSVHVHSLAFDRLNYNKSDNVLSERSANHKYDKFLVDSNSRDSKSAKGFDLNVMNEAINLQDEELVGNENKLEDVAAKLPWLKAMPASKNEGRMPKNQNELVSQNVASTSSERDIKAKEEIGETQNVKKILGVLILENPRVSKNESSLLASTSAAIQPSPEEHNRNGKKNVVIDINMAWDLSNGELEDHVAPEPLVGEKGMISKDTSIRNHIDLNFCIPEEEDQSGPSAATSNVRTNCVLEIDLEAPIVLDSEEDNLMEDEHMQHEASLQLPEHKAEQAQDEVASFAAEAIVAISSSGMCMQIEETCHDPSEDPLEKSLQWFANVVSSCADEHKCKSDKEIRGKDGVPNESSFEGIDYFEVMTLQLTETKEEDYMPKPFIPEFQYVEDIGATSVPNRPRRGQSRRGRQRRDFQRDILPGLASLSRHEVTEDIQTFGGLMRATGHTWTCGLTRRNGTRNGGARGRRRTVVIDTGPLPAPPASSSVATPLAQQLSNIEAVLEDKSLTGWGKTTRRPRRQRCPAGNPPAVPLT